MGGLVDYSSSSSSTASEEDEGPSYREQQQRKRRRVEPSGDTDGKSTNRQDEAGRESQSSMPPLPATFHDLYASTVKHSVTDDPSLHQGRRRQTPHIAGNWPTHVYVEWHPSDAQQNKLVQLMDAVKSVMSKAEVIHDFLVSDLGTAMPLHISLSKPLSLPTDVKDLYLQQVSSSIQSSSLKPFDVSPVGLAWCRSPDSDRSFLVLRVTSRKQDASDSAGDNPELMKLLKRCNVVAAGMDQPVLYQQNHEELVGSAFHVSIGWTLGLPQDEATLKVLKLFRQPEFEEIKHWKIKVDAVKVKVGNVVSHVDLGKTRARIEASLFD